MTHYPTASDPLEPLRYGLVALTDHAHAGAIKQQIVGRLQARIAAAPRRNRARRLWRLSASIGALLAVVVPSGLLVGYSLGSSESTLRIEPAGNSQLVWSGAVTELRRLTRADSLPARGRLAVLGDMGAKLVTSRNVEIELGGHTRVSLEPMRAEHGPRGLELEEGTLHCTVPKAWGAEPFVVSVGATRITAQGSRFSVARSPSAHERLCVRVEVGRVELRQAGQSSSVTTGQARGCTSDYAAELALEQPE